MCLLNKTPEYILLFLLLLSKNIFGTYGSSGPPPSLFRDNDNYHSIATTTAAAAAAAAATTTTLMPSSILSTTTIDPASLTNSTMKPEKTWSDISLNVLKATIMISIIVAAVFGNLLVIISVMRNRKLRWVSFVIENFNFSFFFFWFQFYNSFIVFALFFFLWVRIIRHSFYCLLIIIQTKIILFFFHFQSFYLAIISISLTITIMSAFFVH